MTPREQSEHGVQLLKQAIITYLSIHSDGATNAEIAEDLKLRSDFEGNQKDYLSYSVLGLLIGENKIRHEKIGSRRLYFINKPA